MDHLAFLGKKEKKFYLIRVVQHCKTPNKGVCWDALKGNQRKKKGGKGHFLR